MEGEGGLNREKWIEQEELKERLARKKDGCQTEGMLMLIWWEGVAGKNGAIMRGRYQPGRRMG